MNMSSSAGRVEAYDAQSPNWADLSGGYEYCIVLRNQTDTDITAGTMDIECAQPRADDHCQPDTWGPLEEPIGCVSITSNSFAPQQARIELSAEFPIKAYSQCAFSAPCPCPFIRVDNVPSGLSAIVVVGRLKRTGGPMIPGYQHP